MTFPLRTFARSFLLWVTCASVALSGCVSGPRFRPTHAPADTAVVYLYRPSKFFGAVLDPDVYVDGKVELTIGNGEYRPIVLSPGVHEIQVKAGTGEEAGSIKFSVVPDRAYFLRFEWLAPEGFQSGGLIGDLAHLSSYEGGKESIEREHVQSEFTPRLFFVKPDRASEINDTSLEAEMKTQEGQPSGETYPADP